MNAIGPRNPQPIAIAPKPPAEPFMPPRVAHALACALEPVTGRGRFGEDDPGHRVATPLLTPDQFAAARMAAAEFDRLLEPVTIAHLAAWLMPVNSASRNPQAPSEFRLRCEGLIAMLDDLPAAAFTAEARRKLATGFFPSHEDIRSAVEPVADGWRRKRDALYGLRMAEAPQQQARTEPTDAEVQHVRAAAEAFRAEVAARQAAIQRDTAKPVPLKPHDLLAAYEAAAANGNPAAAFRAAQMREALGE